MAQLEGFWSYVHSDDESDDGRISTLARDVGNEYEMLTGEEIKLFLDKDAVSWGEDWQSKIANSLSSVAFFIPIITPRYFKSSACRREMRYFANQAKQLGVEDLVLPLIYIDVPSLHDETSDDDLVDIVKTFQWVDWRELRFADLSSGVYRRGVSMLAQRLVEANKKAEEVDIAEIASQFESTTEADDDSLGLIDQLAAMEETMPQWQTTLEEIASAINEINQLTHKASSDIERGDSQGKGFAARLAVARTLSRQMDDPAENILSLGNDFASQLHRIDTGIRIIINRSAAEVRETPSSKPQLCAFFQAVRKLSGAANNGLAAVQSMIEAISPAESLSKDLRKPFRKLKQGLTLMVEAREVTSEWIRLIEETDIDCSEEESQGKPPDREIVRAQSLVGRYVPEDRSLSGELISERREESARE